MRAKAVTRASEPTTPRIPKRGQRTPPQVAGAATEALYLRVARSLRGDIVAGTYPVGAQLPTEDELRKRFKVSRHTVREALRRLREDNLIASRQGSGTVVASSPATDAYAHDMMSVNDLVTWSVGKRFAIDDMEMTQLDESLAAHTGLEGGQTWLAVRGFGHEEGLEVPVCAAEYYIHKDFAAIGRLLQRHKGPIFPLIEDLFGVKVVAVHQSIAASLVTPELASALEVESGSPALVVRRAYALLNGQTAQVTVSTHPATRYRHSMTLRRIRQ